MTRLAQEVRATQNPALGAAAVWRLACGYRNEHAEKSFAPLHLAFLVLPIVFHRPLLEVMDSHIAMNRRPQ